MGNSRLRPETQSAPGSFAPKGATAYYAIYGAVQAEAGLIHGRLDNDDGEHCAVGAYFDHTKQALGTDIIDEVATVNDSVPTFTPKQRKAFVVKWLRWRLTQLGMTGFRTRTLPQKDR